MDFQVLNLNGFSLEPLKGKDVFSVFDEATRYLESVGVVYWVSAGTMLGLWRDKDFIADDTDIDLEVFVPGEMPMVNKMPGGELVRVSFMDGQVCQLAYVCDNNIIVDIYFYRKKDDKILSCSETSGIISYPVGFIDTIRDFNFNGKKYKCMEPEMYLEYLYGEEWRTPKREKPIWK